MADEEPSEGGNEARADNAPHIRPQAIGLRNSKSCANQSEFTDGTLRLTYHGDRGWLENADGDGRGTRTTQVARATRRVAHQRAVLCSRPPSDTETSLLTSPGSPWCFWSPKQCQLRECCLHAAKVQKCACHPQLVNAVTDLQYSDRLREDTK